MIDIRTGKDLKDIPILEEPALRIYIFHNTAGKINKAFLFIICYLLITHRGVLFYLLWLSKYIDRLRHNRCNIHR